MPCLPPLREKDERGLQNRVPFQEDNGQKPTKPSLIPPLEKKYDKLYKELS